VEAAESYGRKARAKREELASVSFPPVLFVRHDPCFQVFVVIDSGDFVAVKINRYAASLDIGAGRTLGVDVIPTVFPKRAIHHRRADKVPHQVSVHTHFDTFQQILIKQITLLNGDLVSSREPNRIAAAG